MKTRLNFLVLICLIQFISCNNTNTTKTIITSGNSDTIKHIVLWTYMAKQESDSVVADTAKPHLTEEFIYTKSGDIAYRYELKSRKYEITNYKYDKQKRLVEELKTTPKGDQTSRKEFIYEFDLLYDEVWYNENDDIILKGYYEYDSLNRLTRTISAKEDNILMNYLEFTYTDTSKKEVRYVGDGIQIASSITYNDSLGRMAKSVEMDSATITTKHYKYIGDDSIIDVLQQSLEGNFMHKAHAFYSKDSIRFEYYNVADSIIETTDEIYNKHGDLVKITNSFPLQDSTSVFEKRYSYDDKGNWIRCHKYSNGNPTFVEKRDIYYF